jgi:hypothetical protein
MGLLLADAAAHIDELWTTEAVPLLHDYIAIPALSPMFDANWQSSGHLDRATLLLHDWARSRNIAGLAVSTTPSADELRSLCAKYQRSVLAHPNAPCFSTATWTSNPR